MVISNQLIQPWTLNPKEGLVRSFNFDSFPQAIAFVNRIADVAETQQHHPTIEISYRTVTLRLITHDAGNQVTDKDYELARLINYCL